MAESTVDLPSSVVLSAVERRLAVLRPEVARLGDQIARDDEKREQQRLAYREWELARDRWVGKQVGSRSRFFARPSVEVCRSLYPCPAPPQPNRCMLWDTCRSSMLRQRAEVCWLEDLAKIARCCSQMTLTIADARRAGVGDDDTPPPETTDED